MIAFAINRLGFLPSMFCFVLQPPLVAVSMCRACPRLRKLPCRHLERRHKKLRKKTMFEGHRPCGSFLRFWCHLSNCFLYSLCTELVPRPRSQLERWHKKQRKTVCGG